MNRKYVENMINDLESCVHSENWYKISCYKQRIACYENAIRIVYMEWLKSKGMNEVEAFYRAEVFAKKVIKNMENKK